MTECFPPLVSRHNTFDFRGTGVLPIAPEPGLCAFRPATPPAGGVAPGLFGNPTAFAPLAPEHGGDPSS